MSSAVSAARKRRAGIIPQEPSRTINPISNTNTPAPSQKNGLTLPEVIALVDKRLTTLEKFMNDTKDNIEVPREPKVKFQIDESEINSSVSNDIIEEFNSRFILLSEEISNIKDIVLSLQSYTMSVNKVLMEERIQIISNLETIEEGDEKNISEDIEKNKKEETKTELEDGMTEYGIPIPSKIQRIYSDTIFLSENTV